MKKIIFALMLLVSTTLVTQGQTPMTNPNGLLLDTVTNSAAEGPLLQVKSFQNTISIHLPITKISGTIEGSIKWQGSNDGLTYFTVSSDTLTDATNVYGYSEAPKKWLYYKALISPSGTSSLSYKGILYTTRQ